MIKNNNMNKKEQIAYEYLKSLGYKSIKFNTNSSPDFETKDGKGWEVKPYPNYKFTENQLYIMDFNTTIIFVDKYDDIFISPFYEILYNYIDYTELDSNGIDIRVGFFKAQYDFYNGSLYPTVVPFAEFIKTKSRMREEEYYKNFKKLDIEIKKEYRQKMINEGIFDKYAIR